WAGNGVTQWSPSYPNSAVLSVRTATREPITATARSTGSWAAASMAAASPASRPGSSRRACSRTGTTRYSTSTARSWVGCSLRSGDFRPSSCSASFRAARHSTCNSYERARHLHRPCAAPAKRPIRSPVGRFLSKNPTPPATSGSNLSELQKGSNVEVAAGIFLTRLVLRFQPAEFQQQQQIGRQVLVDPDRDLVVLVDQ